MKRTGWGKRGVLAAFTFVAFFGGLGVASASAQKSPMEVIKSATDRALHTLQTCPGGTPENIKARRQAARAIAEEYVDFEEAGSARWAGTGKA